MTYRDTAVQQTKIVTVPDSGCLPRRYELVEKELHYIVRMTEWDGDKWVVCYPAHWVGSKSPDNRPNAVRALDKVFQTYIQSLLNCEYDFFVTKELPEESKCAAGDKATTQQKC